MKLTQKFCETAGKGIYWDSQLPGFGLRVHPRSKSFVLFVRDENKKKRQTVVGHVGDLTLVDARERARQIKEGKTTEPQKKGFSVAEACQIYLDEYAKEHKRSWLKDEQRIKRLILPALGAMRMESLTPVDAMRWHKGIKAPYEANRALEVLSCVYNYHLKMCRIACPNPCRAVIPNREEPRDRYLTVDEIRRLRAAIDELPASPRAALLLLMYSGRRLNEVLTLEWADVRLTSEFGPYFEIGADKCKQKKKQIVPLSPPAVDAISSLSITSRFVFPSPDNLDEPRARIEKRWKWAVKKAGIENVRMHDLRRSVASALAQNGRTALEAASAIGDTAQTAERHYIHFGVGNVRAMLEDYAGLVQ